MPMGEVNIFWLFEILVIFVVHNYLNRNEVNITKNAGTKKQGRHIGESPSALLRLRLGMLCSDRPFLFTYNLIIMHNNESDCTIRNNSTEELLEKIFLVDWINDGPKVKQTLNKLLLGYIQADIFEYLSQEQRSELAFHLLIINTLIDDLIKS